MFVPQFVPFRDYIDRTGNHILSMARLAKDVLAEIPDQFLSYMRTRGIKPSPAPPPYTPPGQPLQTQIWGVKMWKTCIWGLESTCRILSFPEAALHALPSWITVAVLIFRNVCVGQDMPHFSTGKANESLFTSTVKHSSWCLDSLFCLISCWIKNLETVWRVEIKLGHKGSPDAGKTRDEENFYTGGRMSPDKTRKTWL